MRSTGITHVIHMSIICESIIPTVIVTYMRSWANIGRNSTSAVDLPLSEVPEGALGGGISAAAGQPMLKTVAAARRVSCWALLVSFSAPASNNPVRAHPQPRATALQKVRVRVARGASGGFGRAREGIVINGIGIGSVIASIDTITGTTSTIVIMAITPIVRRIVVGVASAVAVAVELEKREDLSPGGYSAIPTVRNQPRRIPPSRVVGLRWTPSRGGNPPYPPVPHEMLLGIGLMKGTPGIA